MQRRIVGWGGMDPLCQVCGQPAVTRWKNSHDDLVAAACAEHRHEVQHTLKLRRDLSAGKPDPVKNRVNAAPYP